VAADGSSFHVVTVGIHRDGLEDKPEYGGTLEAALWHGFYDFAYGLGSCGHDHLAVYFHRPCNGGAKAVVVRA
jgi:hypothetical protein